MTGAERTKAQPWHVIIAILAAMTFGYWIWPTPYQYIPVPAGVRIPILAVRVQRFTGVTEYLMPGAWVTVPPTNSVAPSTPAKP